MKRIISIGIIITLLTSNLFSQVQENDIYDVLNEILKLNKVESLQLSSKAFDIPNPIQHEFIEWCINQAENKIDKSLVDSAFIIEQTKKFNELKWNKKKIEKEIEIQKKATHYFSIPLFLNERKDIVIVYHSEYYGPLAASGTYEMYQKINNKWKLKTIMLLWIS
jgi:hypothetical protein